MLNCGNKRRKTFFRSNWMIDLFKWINQSKGEEYPKRRIIDEY